MHICKPITVRRISITFQALICTSVILRKAKQLGKMDVLIGGVVSFYIYKMTIYQSSHSSSSQVAKINSEVPRLRLSALPNRLDHIPSRAFPLRMEVRNWLLNG